jgi:hypothetical protein
MQHSHPVGDTSTARLPRWWLRYLIVIPIVTVIYFLVMFCMLMSGLGFGNAPPPPVFEFMDNVLSFPLLLIGGDGPLSTAEMFLLLAANGAIWGGFIMAIWHASFRLRRHLHRHRTE